MLILFCSIHALLAAFFLAAALSSFNEKSRRAGRILLLTGLLFLFVSLLPWTFRQTGHDFFLFILIPEFVLLLLLFLPFGRREFKLEGERISRFHEADAVLSRRRLQEGTEEYKSYYRAHLEFKEADDRARANPGLLAENSKYFEAHSFAAAEAGFSLTELLYQADEYPVAEKINPVEAGAFTRFIKEWLLESGADAVGFTTLEEHHLYSHKGRGPKAGKSIQKNHPYAIAITVEMSHRFMRYAPAGPTVMESSDQYLRSAMLAVKCCMAIKNLGYEAQAHIDGNYEVICPLVASDAGLGDIGRMGLLMSEKHGPRVRIAVVTTSAPLEIKAKKNKSAAADFCHYCKKCAVNCPANAISKAKQEESDGIRRWKINSERCYNFWTISGTDCGKCVISCPFSHPDTWFHRFIRFGIKNNLLFRIIAVKLDDVFYGRKSRTLDLPDWMSIRKN